MNTTALIAAAAIAQTEANKLAEAKAHIERIEADLQAAKAQAAEIESRFAAAQGAVARATADMVQATLLQAIPSATPTGGLLSRLFS